MTLLNTLKIEQLEARKNRNHVDVGILTTLLSDAVMIGKNNGNRESTDAEVIATIKKFINNINETLNVLDKNATIQINAANHEKNLLEMFLPTQLTEEQVTDILNTIIIEVNATSIKDMGKVMKELKARYDGTYDGTFVSKIIKHKLA